MDTFCVLPWFGREIKWSEKETHCCLLPQTYDIEKIKKTMLAGERPSECQKCWNLEDQGLTSDRQLKNSTLDWYWNRDISAIKNDAISGDNRVRILKLMTSYTCNGTCVTCSSGSSSSWAELETRGTSIPLKKYSFIDLDRVKEKIDFRELKMLSLLGGEPLYEKRNFELLEHILELGNDSVFVSMVTNGSVALTEKQKTTLRKFKNLNFNLSIDGVGLVFEYVRYPLKWKDLTNNLNFFREVTDNISSNYTISNLNIFYHNQTVEWFVKNNIPYSNNPVYGPSCYQPRALPLMAKQQLKNQLTPQDYATYIGEHTLEDQENFEKFKKDIQRQDLLKKISISDYLPELYKFMIV